MKLAVTSCRCRGHDAFAFIADQTTSGWSFSAPASEIRGVLDDDLGSYVLFDANHDYPEIVVDGAVLKRQTTLYNGQPWWSAASGSSGAVFCSVAGSSWIYNPAGLVEPYSFTDEDDVIHGDGWFYLGDRPRAGGEYTLSKCGTYANEDDQTAIPSFSARWPRYELDDDDASADPFVGCFVPNDDDGTLAYGKIVVGNAVYSDGTFEWVYDCDGKRLVCSDGRVYAYRADRLQWMLGEIEDGLWWTGSEPDPPSGLTLGGHSVDGNDPAPINLSYVRCQSSGSGTCLLFEVSKWR